MNSDFYVVFEADRIGEFKQMCLTAISNMTQHITKMEAIEQAEMAELEAYKRLTWYRRLFCPEPTFSYTHMCSMWNAEFNLKEVEGMIEMAEKASSIMVSKGEMSMIKKWETQ